MRQTFFLIICSYFVVNKSLENSPIELMRGGKEKNKVGFIERNHKNILHFLTHSIYKHQNLSNLDYIFLYPMFQA